MESKGEIILYKSGNDFLIDVKLKNETVWLSQKDMAVLFNKDVRTINEHISKENELSETSLGRYRVEINVKL